ncbi:hypothetical protein TanjilG_11429 [Lupinus angustifolius]|uniref:Uncharacterized protein n=1 Tax=Lupinus angustifolius TaxID=3871 RepID=A0A1J7HN60_LUPAN|nr:PREDICTED: uncharacterized protein LOC109344566 [Lupinus angustifolius]OIW14084.1 hypothetical protein TanjilG_11429 [Lupinus angustifolius]
MIRSCISCFLPFGVFDVIRIVHSNGRIEEISGSIKASDIMNAYPNHVLMKSSSPSSSALYGGAAVAPNIEVVRADAELQRGKVYFLKPLLLPRSNKDHTQMKKKKESRRSYSHNNSGESTMSLAKMVFSSDRYLTDMRSRKKFSTEEEDVCLLEASLRKHF